MSGSPMTDAGARRCKTPARRQGLCLRHRGISLEIVLLLFQAPPQPFDENIVQIPALAVHADQDTPVRQFAHKHGAGELHALVCIENFRLTVPLHRLCLRLDAEDRFDNSAIVPSFLIVWTELRLPSKAARNLGRREDFHRSQLPMGARGSETMRIHADEAARAH